MKINDLYFLKNKRLIRIVAVGITMAFLLVDFQGTVLSAKTKGDLESKKEEADQSKSDLEEAGRALKSQLGDLNSDLYDISMTITATEDEIAKLQEDIAEAENELGRAEAVSEEQYESMKKRIQFMYENDGGFSWVMLFEAEDFADFINRAQYMAQVTGTDRKMLEEYRDTQEQIAGYKIQLEEEEETLLAKESELEEEQSSLLAKLSNLKSELADNEDQIAKADADSAKLAKQIKAMEEYEKKLDDAREKEEAQNAKADDNDSDSVTASQDNSATSSSDASSGESSTANSSETNTTTATTAETPATTPTATPTSVGEAELLAALIYCEAGGESYEAQVAVGSVVINRKNSSKFPNTIMGVIYQSGQFSPVASGKLALVLEKNLTTASCRNAANTVLAGNLSGDWLFFKLNNGTTEGTVINKQVFY